MEKNMVEIESMVEKKNLENAPKVSAKVREYVWRYIYERLLVPRKIMLDAPYDYRFTLDLNEFNPEIHKFFTDNPFNTDEDKFRPEPRFNKLGNLKFVVLRVVSKNICNNTSPSEYANIVYDAFGSFLVTIYKKVTKSDFENLKQSMDYEYINNLPFPASLKECRFFIV